MDGNQLRLSSPIAMDGLFPRLLFRYPTVHGAPRSPADFRRSRGACHRGLLRTCRAFDGGGAYARVPRGLSRRTLAPGTFARRDPGPQRGCRRNARDAACLRARSMRVARSRECRDRLAGASDRLDRLPARNLGFVTQCRASCEFFIPLAVHRGRGATGALALGEVRTRHLS